MIDTYILKCGYFFKTLPYKYIYGNEQKINTISIF